MRHPFGLFTLSIFIVLLATAGCGGEQGADGTEMTGDTVATGPMDTLAHRSAMRDTVQKINLNTAGEEEFKTIPNVGDRMAHEFEEYRPYVSIQQFRREIGKYVDEGQVVAYETYVYVPIDPNESDAETLMQIKGLEESEAASLIEARPFESDEAFLEALAEYVPEGELDSAERYLAGR